LRAASRSLAVQPVRVQTGSSMGWLRGVAMRSIGIMGAAPVPACRPDEAHIILWAWETHPQHLLWRPAALIILMSPIVHWEPAPYLIEQSPPPAIRAVWSDQHRFELWLRIEILACEAWATLGRIPESALPKIRRGSLRAAPRARGGAQTWDQRTASP